MSTEQESIEAFEALAAIRRVKVHIAKMRGVAEATMFPDVREWLTAAMDDLDAAIKGEQ